MKKMFLFFILSFCFSLFCQTQQEIDHMQQVNYAQYLAISDISNYTLTMQMGDYIKKNVNASMIIFGFDSWYGSADTLDVMSLRNRPGKGVLPETSGSMSRANLFIKNVGFENLKISGGLTFYFPSTIHSRIGSSVLASTDDNSSLYTGDFSNIGDYNYHLSGSVKLFDILELGVEQRSIHLNSYYYLAGSAPFIDYLYDSEPDKSLQIEEKYYQFSLNLFDVTFWNSGSSNIDNLQLFNSFSVDENYNLDSLNTFFVTKWDKVPFININRNNVFDFWTMDVSFQAQTPVMNFWIKPKFSDSVSNYMQSVDLFIDFYPMIFQHLSGMGAGYWNDEVEKSYELLFDERLDTDEMAFINMAGLGINYLLESPYYILENQQIKDQLSPYGSINLILRIGSFFFNFECTGGLNDPLVSQKYLYSDYPADTFDYRNMFVRGSWYLGLIW